MNASRTRAALDLLAPAETFVPDWGDVLARTDVLPDLISPPHRRPSRVQRRVLVFALFIALLIPLATVAADHEWWFLKGEPAPASEVVVVRTGSWDGHEWQIAAFRSATGAICFSFTPAEHVSGGAAAVMACSTLEPHGISFLAGAVGEDGAGYVIGPATAAVREVQITLRSGKVLAAQTFEVPPSLGDLRFYAVEVPASAIPLSELASPRMVVGVDATGHPVACLSDADDGTERLSAQCR